MGLDTIVFFSTAAGTGAALAPTSAVIKGNTGDAYIVGFRCGPEGTDQSTWQMACPGDPRWEAAGVLKLASYTDANATLLPGLVHHGDCWLATKIPIKCGATLTCVSVTGADNGYAAVYVDYPQFGDPFKVRDPAAGQPAAFEVSKTITAGAALVAMTITANSANNATFQRGRSYTPVGVEGNYAGTTPFWIGIRNTKYNLCTYWPCAAENLIIGGGTKHYLPYGLGTVDGGETAFFDFLSTTAETPVAIVTYAYTA